MVDTGYAVGVAARERNGGRSCIGAYGTYSINCSVEGSFLACDPVEITSFVEKIFQHCVCFLSFWKGDATWRSGRVDGYVLLAHHHLHPVDAFAYHKFDGIGGNDARRVKGFEPLDLLSNFLLAEVDVLICTIYAKNVVLRVAADERSCVERDLLQGTRDGKRTIPDFDLLPSCPMRNLILPTECKISPRTVHKAPPNSSTMIWRGLRLLPLKLWENASQLRF